MSGGEITVESASPRSPEAEIGIRVEDLWEVLEPQLTPTEKLNSCFQDLPVSSFPTPLSQGTIFFSFISFFFFVLFDGCLALQYAQLVSIWMLSLFQLEFSMK